MPCGCWPTFCMLKIAVVQTNSAVYNELTSINLVRYSSSRLNAQSLFAKVYWLSEQLKKRRAALWAFTRLHRVAQLPIDGILLMHQSVIMYHYVDCFMELCSVTNVCDCTCMLELHNAHYRGGSSVVKKPHCAGLTHAAARQQSTHVWWWHMQQQAAADGAYATAVSYSAQYTHV